MPSSTPSPPRCDSLLDRLKANAERQPAKVAASFLLPATSSFGGKVGGQLTYGQLDEATTALANRLLDVEGLAKGDRCVL